MTEQTPACDVLDGFWKKGREFLGTRYAIMGGAMSWISERHLVSAISNAGGFGVIASGAMPPELLEQEILETRKMTENNFGVNLITMHPRLDELIDVCIRQKVSHVILAGGIPTALSVKKLKDAGCRVMCFAPALVLAKKMMRIGADALIIEGTEAGRNEHSGTGNRASYSGRSRVCRRRCGIGGHAGRFSGNGRGGMPAGDALRLCDGMHRPSEFQKGLHQCERARRCPDGSD